MIATRFAQYVVSEYDNDFSEDVLIGAKRCLVDWFATTVPGGVRAPATLLAAALDEEVAGETSVGYSELFPGGMTTNMRTAALINAAAAHTVEFDDIWRDGLYHPGAPVISAALAVAQNRDLSGLDFLRAVIVGYEVSDRMAAGINPAHYRYWHTTATIGHHGAAAAAASALKLNVEQTAHALNNVTSFAAGLQQAFRTDAMTKPFHVGQAAGNGVLAALAASRGVTGARAMLEGEVGLGRAMGDDPDWDAMFEGLGSDYTITQVTQKNHGCCGHTFASLDAALALKAEYGFSFDDIKRVRAHSYQAALDICGNNAPGTAAEARFSLPYVVAAAMRFGSVRLKAFEPENLQDHALLDLSSRVEVIVDPELQSRFPGARSATVEIELNDGTTLSRHAPTRKGDPENPLSIAEINDKYDELVTPELGNVAQALRATLWDMERDRSVRNLIARFSPTQRVVSG